MRFAYETPKNRMKVKRINVKRMNSKRMDSQTSTKPTKAELKKKAKSAKRLCYEISLEKGPFTTFPAISSQLVLRKSLRMSTHHGSTLCITLVSGIQYLTLCMPFPLQCCKTKRNQSFRRRMQLYWICM